jgi:hypothetical protein
MWKVWERHVLLPSGQLRFSLAFEFQFPVAEYAEPDPPEGWSNPTQLCLLAIALLTLGEENSASSQL